MRRFLTVRSRGVRPGIWSAWFFFVCLVCCRPIAVEAIASPTMVKGLSAWYDASSATSITVASGAAVPAWNDLSTNAETLAQATSANQPILTANCVNSLKCVTFNGTSNYFAANDTNFQRFLLPASTVFIVEKSANDTQSSSTLSVVGGSGLRYNLHLPYSSAVYFDLGDATSNRISIATTSNTTVGPHLWTALGTEGGAQFLGRDGVSIVSATAINTGESPGTCAVSVGAYSTCGAAYQNYFTGSIEEIIVYNVAMSAAEYQFVEGYLAWKWGIQANLPAGHPYTSAAPTGGAGAFPLTTVVAPTGAQVPGTDLTYTTTYINNGGIIDYNPVVVAPIPANTAFKLASATSNQSTTGLTVVVSYSNNGGSTYAYTPLSAGGGAPSGYDATVTNVKWSFTGALGCGSVNNTGTTAFIARVL